MLSKFSSGKLKGTTTPNNHLKVIGFVLKCIIHYGIWKSGLYPDSLKHGAVARSCEHHNGCEFWVSASSVSEVSFVLLRNALLWGEMLPTLRRHYHSKRRQLLYWTTQCHIPAAFMFMTMGIQFPREALVVLSVWAYILSKWTLPIPICGIRILGL